MNGVVANITQENNSIANASSAVPEPSVVAQVGLAALYIFGISTGTLGNVLVVIVVTVNRSMRTGTNLFIASLSAADLLVTTVCMPPFFVYNVITWPIWPFGREACRALSYLVHTSVMASALSLLCISYDRFVAVYLPLRRLLKPATAAIILGVVWLASPLLLLPSVFHHDVVTEKRQGQTLVMCMESWPTDRQLHDYQLFRVSCYFLFVIQISVVYCLIGRRLYKRVPPGIQSNNARSRSLLHKRKVVKMLLLVITWFTLSWLPYIMNKMLNILPPRPGFRTPDLFVFIGNFLGLLNSCINPILYAVLNKNFRTAFKNALRCKCHSDLEERRRTVHSGSFITKQGTIKKSGKSFRLSRQGILDAADKKEVDEQQDTERQKRAAEIEQNFENLSFETFNDCSQISRNPQKRGISFNSSKRLSSSKSEPIDNGSNCDEEKVKELSQDRKSGCSQEKNDKQASPRGRWTRRIGSVEATLVLESGITNKALSTIDEQSYC